MAATLKVIIRVWTREDDEVNEGGDETRTYPKGENEDENQSMSTLGTGSHHQDTSQMRVHSATPEVERQGSDEEGGYSDDESHSQYPPGRGRSRSLYTVWVALQLHINPDITPAGVRILPRPGLRQRIWIMRLGAMTL